jgi:hypothetical protein
MVGCTTAKMVGAKVVGLTDNGIVLSIMTLVGAVVGKIVG